LNIRSISDKIAATITKFKQSQKVSVEEKLIDGKLSIEFSAERIKLVINNTIISVNAQDDYILTRDFSRKDEIINKIRTLRYEVKKSSNNSEEKRKTHFLLQRMEYILTSAGGPQIVIVSASVGPGRAYSVKDAESFVYRRDENGKKWKKAISNGLPEPKGTTITVLASNSRVAGEFYAVNNRGLFMSTDSGISWRGLDIQWAKEYLLLQPPWALEVSDKK
jgi:hypothetical protein